MTARRLALGAGFVAIAGLMLAFAVQDRLASFGDDSASYLVIANYFAGASGNAYAAQWAPYQSHFPPLFPAILWLSGGAGDYRIAYGVVATFAALALPLIHRHAARELGDGAALAVTALFLLMPTAWITLKGVMSESLYLFMAMACIAFFESRIANRRPSQVEGLLFGTLMALACLSRTLGIALVAAYILHCTVRIAVKREAPSTRLAVPLVPVAVILALWYALRPTSGVDTYGRTAGQLLGQWLRDPTAMLAAAWGNLAAGWTSSFAVQADVSVILATLTLALGALALAGVVLRVARNRFDGWFLLISLAIVFPWVFSGENTRRLLYPLVPLLLVSGASAIRDAFDRGWIFDRARAYVSGIAIALTAVASLPAFVLVVHKSLDRETVIPGYAYTYREVSEYYTTVNLDAARDRAKLAVVTLAGLESIERETPRDSRVMWMRPEYVGLLGHRPGVAFLYRWTPAELAREVQRADVGYIVQGWLSKTDLEVAQGNARLDVGAYAHPSFQIGGIFELMQVDRAALDRFVAQAAKP